MENINIILAANILKYRKKSGLSQDELAQKIGVTFQAVSKGNKLVSFTVIDTLNNSVRFTGLFI